MQRPVAAVRSTRSSSLIGCPSGNDEKGQSLFVIRKQQSAEKKENIMSSTDSTTLNARQSELAEALYQAYRNNF